MKDNYHSCSIIIGFSSGQKTLNCQDNLLYTATWACIVWWHTDRRLLLEWWRAALSTKCAVICTASVERCLSLREFVLSSPGSCCIHQQVRLALAEWAVAWNLVSCQLIASQMYSLLAAWLAWEDSQPWTLLWRGVEYLGWDYNFTSWNFMPYKLCIRICPSYARAVNTLFVCWWYR